MKSRFFDEIYLRIKPVWLFDMTFILFKNLFEIKVQKFN